VRRNVIISENLYAKISRLHCYNCKRIGNGKDNENGKGNDMWGLSCVSNVQLIAQLVLEFARKQKKI